MLRIPTFLSLSLLVLMAVGPQASASVVEEIKDETPIQAPSNQSLSPSNSDSENDEDSKEEDENSITSRYTFEVRDVTPEDFGAFKSSSLIPSLMEKMQIGLWFIMAGPIWVKDQALSLYAQALDFGHKVVGFWGHPKED